MRGFYKANGCCGYVKKPDFLMQTCPDGKVFDPKADLPVKATLKVVCFFLFFFFLLSLWVSEMCWFGSGLQVKVYMGEGWQKDFKQTHFDTYSPPDFYVKVCSLIAPVPMFRSQRRL